MVGTWLSLVEALVGHPGGRPSGAAELRPEHGLVGQVSLDVVTLLHHQHQHQAPEEERHPATWNHGQSFRVKQK